MRQLESHEDGGCFPNPGGIATYGVIVQEVDLPSMIWFASGVAGESSIMSNNVAEYSALIQLLEWFEKNGNDDALTIYSDSAILVNQMNRKWSASSDKLYYSYYCRAISLMDKHGLSWKNRIKFKQIPREENEIADELSTMAREEYKRKKCGIV